MRPVLATVAGLVLLAAVAAQGTLVVRGDRNEMEARATLAPRDRKVVAGVRLDAEFSRGAIACDFAAKKLWLAGHFQRNEVYEFDLPTSLGTGADPAQWPLLKPVKTIPGWWPASEGYCNGLAYFRGKLWVSPRVYYDQAPTPTLTLYAQDGEKITLNLPRQKFSGFVKRKGEGPYVGGGGYESGQGSACGPTLADLSGKILIDRALFSASWEQREKRDANYSVREKGAVVDNWVGFNPRNGEGRWASDRIFGGGLVLPEGITYWPWMGTGTLDYARQTETFGAGTQSYVYHYDPVTFVLKGYEVARLPKVVGQEIDPQGRVWLCHCDPLGKAGDQWPMVKVYE
jgi:hypothetical protein